MIRSRDLQFSAWWAALFTAGIVLLFFQNCTAMRAVTDTSQAPSQFGGGTGYDGKIFAQRSTIECPDKSYVKDRAVILNSQPTLVRENCVDLASPRILNALISGQTIVAEGKSLDLESVPPNLAGEFVTSDLGDYAPAVYAVDLGLAHNLRATPLGLENILTVTATGLIGRLTLTARLHARKGLDLKSAGADTRSTTAISFGDDETYNPLASLVGFGTTDAALIVKQNETQYRLLQLNIDSGQPHFLPESTDLTFDAKNLGVQAIDATRAILWYHRMDDNFFAFRTLNLINGAFVFGPELTGPGLPFSAGAPYNSYPAFMPLDANSFYVAFTNGSQVPMYRLTATADILSFNSDPLNLAIDGPNPVGLTMTGLGGDGFMIYRADTTDGTLVYEFRFARNNNGAISNNGRIEKATPFNLSDYHAFGPKTLVVNNRAYFNVGAGAGTSKVYYLEPGSTVAKHYTVEIPRMIFQPTEFFAQDQNLIATGTKDGHGILSVFSTPP